MVRIRVALCLLAALPISADTVALWLFDEPVGAYPSSILNESAGGYILALGRGGRIAEGRFGRSLEISAPEPLKIKADGGSYEDGTGSILFGVGRLPVPKGRTMQPLHWGNATFAALATSGEKHLRSPGFPNVSQSGLNLGGSDWTLEFWYAGRPAPEEGTVYEIGTGPRGENDLLTRITLAADGSAFRLYHRGKTPVLTIPSNAAMLRSGKWLHVAFTYSAADRQLRHYLNGVAQPLPEKVSLTKLDAGEEAYLSIGRDGRFERPLAGRIDEMRVSDKVVYTAAFQPPGSFSLTYSGKVPKEKLQVGPPLLFAGEKTGVVALGGRKHLFIDDALIAESKGITFVVNPPVQKEQVLENLRGHLSMVEDETGLIRIYYRAKNDWLGVVTSRNGVDWQYPDLGVEREGLKNITLFDTVGLGNVFLDPNAPPERRWRYFSGVKRRSMFVYTSKDGWSFQPHETAALPFAGGSQSIVYYDDQRQVYVAHHRSDYGMTHTGKTQRVFLLSETRDLFSPWPYTPATPEVTAKEAKARRIKNERMDPWFVDNGPLSPSGIGVELPVAFSTDDAIDPPSTDIYSTKVIKYPWAPDTYFAFPAVYFHYEGTEPKTRAVHGDADRKKGSGVVEVQIAVSRDGLKWKRFPRPAYIPINSNGRDAIHMMFLTHGMVKRGDEIWQYAGGHAGNGVNYHSAFVKQPNSPLWRFVQRVDGFVAAEAAYTGGEFRTRPLRFEGKHLRLNIDTGATGYAQVGILDENGKPIPGFSLDDCVYVNGDYLNHPVEWLGKGTDVSALQGRNVQLVFRMRGSRLFALQFTPE